MRLLESKANELLTQRVRNKTGSSTIRVMRIRWADPRAGTVTVDLQEDNPDATFTPLPPRTLQIGMMNLDRTISCLEEEIVEAIAEAL